MFEELTVGQQQEIDGGFTYAWEIPAAFVAALYVLDRAYTCGKHCGEALYYVIYE